MEKTPYPTAQFRASATSDTLWNHSTNPGIVNTLESPLSFFPWLRGKVGYPDWPNFSQRAIEAMTPTMESGFSLGNFLYEIREIKSLTKWWDKGRSWFRNISNASLQYSFGLRPFLHDLKAIATGLFEVRDRLEALKSGAGKLCVRHYSEKEDWLEWDDEFLHDGEIYDYTRLQVPHLVRTATMRYVYQMPDIDQSLLELYAWLDYFGLNLNPQVVWDAIPYTFVVDWFFNVGDFLSQLRKKWIPVSIRIIDFGVSEKYNYHLTSECKKTGKVDGPLAPHLDIWGKVYTRRPYKVDDRCFSISPTSTASGNVSLRKIYLGALLLEQRLH
jgi:hypothetical protein